MCVFFEAITKWAIYITHLGVQLLEAITLAKCGHSQNGAFISPKS